MHGRKRSEYKAMQRDPKTAAALANKAQKWHKLMGSLQQLKAAASKETSQQQQAMATAAMTLELLSKALIVNPDPLSLWNQRRSTLLSSSFSLQSELELTQQCLQNHPKAYGAWFHRKWSLVEALKRNINSADDNNVSDDSIRSTLQAELALTQQFLSLDERNFHCWNYRRFVVSCLFHTVGGGVCLQVADGSWQLNLDGTSTSSSSSTGGGGSPSPSMGAQIAIHTTSTSSSYTVATATATSTTNNKEHGKILQTEWDFTKTKIEDNFSNFSAFHYRSKLLPLLLVLKSTATTVPESNNANATTTSLLIEELELVENAVFTEPDDQTAWWYQAFLLDFATKSLATATPEATMTKEESLSVWTTRLQEHEASLQELAEEAGQTSKWIWLGLLQVWQSLDQCKDKSLITTTSSSSKEKQIKVLREHLIPMDPDRQVRYQTMIQDLQQ